MFSKLLSFLFPPNKDEELINSLTYLKLFEHTIVTPRGIKVTTLSRYSEPSVHASIVLLKRYGNVHAAKLLAQLLNDVLSAELSDINLWDSKNVIIIPVPTTKKRRRERGFSPIEKIFKFLSDDLRALIVTDVLLQTKNIPMQKTLNRVERFKNVAGIFTVTNKNLIREKHVVLIDDVLTTGATLDEAVHTLTQSGVKVTSIAITRA